MAAIFGERFWRAVFVLAAMFAIMMATLRHPPLQGEVSDKWLHALAFTVLTILARLAFPCARDLSVLLGLIALGGFIELVQALPALGRNASLADWVVDIIAIMPTLLSLRFLQKIWVSTNTARNQ